MPTPRDPNNPNNPNPNPDPNPLPFGKSPDSTPIDIEIDAAKFHARMKKIFGAAFEEMRKTGLDSFKHVYASAIKSHKLYETAASTADRNRYRALIDNQKKILDTILRQGRVEKQIIEENVTDETKLKEELGRKELEIADKIAKVKKANEAKIKEAHEAAVRSEREGISKVLGGIKDKTREYAKSLLDTKSLWEAVVFLLIQASNRVPQITKAQAALRTAGLAGTAPTLGLQALQGKAGQAPGLIGGELGAIREGIFGPLRKELPITEDQIDQFVGTLAKAPRLLQAGSVQNVMKDGGKATRDFIAEMGAMGVSIEDSLDLMVNASNNWGMSVGDLNRTFRASAGLVKATGINFKDVFNIMGGLSQQLRSLTFNATAAENVFTATAVPLRQIGFMPSDIEKFTDSMGQLLANLSPSKLAGITAFTSGGFLGGVAGRARSQAAADRPEEQMIAFARKALSGFQKGTEERLFAIEALAKQGFAPAVAGTRQGAIGFEKIVDSFGGNVDDMKKELDKLKESLKPKETEMERLQREGFSTLANLDTPLKNIENILMSIFQQISTPLTGFLGQATPAMAALRTALAPATAMSNVRQGMGTITGDPMESLRVAGRLAKDAALLGIATSPFLPSMNLNTRQRREKQR